MNERYKHLNSISKIRKAAIKVAEQEEIDFEDPYSVEEVFQNAADKLIAILYLKEYKEIREFYVEEERKIRLELIDKISWRVANHYLMEAKSNFKSSVINIREYYGINNHKIKLDGIEW